MNINFDKVDMKFSPDGTKIYISVPYSKRFAELLHLNLTVDDYTHYEWYGEGQCWKIYTWGEQWVIDRLVTILEVLYPLPHTTI